MKFNNLFILKHLTLIKTLSWHMVHISMVSLVTFIVTGNIKFAAIIASMELLWESIIYFMHEKIWEKIKKKINN